MVWCLPSWQFFLQYMTPSGPSPMHTRLPNESVKEFVASTELKSVPLMHSIIETQPQAINLGSAEEIELPVIDLYMLSQGAVEQQVAQVQNLKHALEEWGFFQVVNHGVATELRDELMRAFQAFFNLPLEEKQKYADKFADTRVMDMIRYGTSFNLKKDDVKYWRVFLKLFIHPELHCPSNPPQLRESLSEFAKCIREVGRQLLKGVCKSLSIDERYMTETLKFDSSFQMLVCNVYPKCPGPDLAVGLPPHSDHGLLGILYQNDIDGLELIHDGKWVQVKGIPNSFLVNTGDHLEIASNGKYKSVVHRVVANQEETRVTIVTTACPAADIAVLPAPELVTSETPAMFRGMKYKEYIECQQRHGLKDKTILDMLRI